MNEAENEAGNKALDSLINYETVKVRFLITSAFTSRYVMLEFPGRDYFFQ